MGTCPEGCNHDAPPVEVANLNHRYASQLVWRGFDLCWTYNHRINRIGSFVWPQGEGEAKMVGTAASGSGEDVALIDGFGSWVQGEGLTLISGALTLVLSGREGELLQSQATVRVPDAPPGAAAVLLGGFDLAVGLSTEEKADSDKLQRLVMGVRDLRREGGALVFEVDGALLARCRSAECEPFDKKVNYRLQIWYTVLVGAGLVAQAPVALSDAYSWDEKREIDLSPRFADVTLPADVTGCLVGLERVDFILDREHHLLELCARLDSPNRLADGRWRFGWKAGVKNWREGMREEQFWSFRAGGSVALALRARALGFQSARCSAVSQQGCVDWPGRNHSNQDPASICGFGLKQTDVA